MRDIKVIEADIAKLQAELADAKDHQSMRDAAVHILKNLGWTYNRGWKKPSIKANIFDSKSMTHIKAGDWVHVKTSLATGPRQGFAYVRSVRGSYVTVSFVAGVNFVGANVENNKHTVMARECKVVSHEQVVSAYW